MQDSEQTVEVTLSIPKQIYQQVEQTANHEKQQVEDILKTLIAEGLETHRSVRQILEQVSNQYRDRLLSEGKLNQSSSQVFQELQNIREQVVDELYP